MKRPSRRVLDAFTLTEPPVRLAGARGEIWRSGAVLLRRTDASSAWRAEVLSALPESADFRVARPVRARDGAWAAFGWEASELPIDATDSWRTLNWLGRWSPRDRRWAWRPWRRRRQTVICRGA